MGAGLFYSNGFFSGSFFFFTSFFLYKDHTPQLNALMEHLSQFRLGGCQQQYPREGGRVGGGIWNLLLGTRR